MKSSDTTLPISFEFFPPKTPDGIEKLGQVLRELYELSPQFLSVTYGAGGSTQDSTMEIVQSILADGQPAAPHYSCVGSGKEGVRAQLAQFEQAGISRIVALRGDLPSGHGSFGEFRYASELIEFIRGEPAGSRLHIEVACYPEVHPQARSPDADLQAFAEKVRAGASSAITQYFFNADAYFDFVDRARRVGADIPIVPGVMPIVSSSRLMRFSDACGAEIPRWVRLRLQSFGDDSASIRAFGLDVVTELCERLIAGGAPSLHFYTMNQSAPSLEICKRLGLGLAGRAP